MNGTKMEEYANKRDEISISRFFFVLRSTNVKCRCDGGNMNLIKGQANYYLKMAENAIIESISLYQFNSIHRDLYSNHV